MVDSEPLDLNWTTQIREIDRNRYGRGGPPSPVAKTSPTHMNQGLRATIRCGKVRGDRGDQGELTKGDSSTKIERGQRVAWNGGDRILHTSATISDEPRAKEEGAVGSAASQDLREAR